jgi:hypothetical protein
VAWSSRLGDDGAEREMVGGTGTNWVGRPGTEVDGVGSSVSGARDALRQAAEGGGKVHSQLPKGLVRVPVRMRRCAWWMYRWVAVKVAVHPWSQSCPMDSSEPVVSEGKI